MGTKEDIKKVRKIIKKRCPTVSVRMGKGTAWGWADISSRKIGALFTEKEKKCLRSFGLRPGSNWDNIPPDKLKVFIRNKRVTWKYP